MKKILLSSLLVTSLFAENRLYMAETSIGGQISLYGIGLNAKIKVNDYLGLRAGFDKFKKNDINIDVKGDGDIDTNYNFDLDLQDFLLVGDYHPWKSPFRFSGGMVVNGSNLDGVITPVVRDGKDVEFEFNGHKYSTKEVGSVNTKVDWDPVAPYIGIGYDSTFNKKDTWGWTFDLGLSFQGSAKATYKVNYGASLQDNPNDTAIEKEAKAQTRAEIKQDLDREMNSLQKDLDDYKILPYISLGINYKF